MALPSKLSSPPPHRCSYAPASYSEAAFIIRRRRFVSDIRSRIGGRNDSVVVAAGRREYRKVRSRRVAAAAKKSKEKELELSVKICLEEQLPEDPEIMVMTQFFSSRLDVTAPVALLIMFFACISV